MELPADDGAALTRGSGDVPPVDPTPEAMHRPRLCVAVCDSSDGTEVVRLTDDAEAARVLRLKHRDVFWCSTQAGGCGGRLRLKAGKIRRPHFAHVHSKVACRHRQKPDDAERSYEHLHYQDALVAWLARQGLTAHTEHTFDQGGRADLHVIVAGTSHTIEVQLSPLTDASWADRDDLYRRSVDQVTWLYGPHAGTGAEREQAARGWALLIGQDVALGVKSHSTEKWSPLDDCTMTATGILVPGLREAMDEHAACIRQRDAAEREAADRARAQREFRERQERLLRERQGRRTRDDVPYQMPESPRHDSIQASLTTWRAFHPEAELWTPRQGWGFLETLAETEHEAARFIAYLCRRIYVGGPVRMFAVDGVSNPDDILDALQEGRLVTRLERKGVSRWSRA